MLGKPNATPPPLNGPTNTPPGRKSIAALLVILLVAGVLRLPWLATYPPGLNQDEAANAWNAYCLLKTGRDQVGQPWPIFYFRALGENRSTLFLYVLLPFQALGGLNVWTTRLPAAIGGILTVLLTYWFAKRLFGPHVGLAAAALLAIDPTHTQLSRWGHEASLTPLLTLAPLAALLWAGLPLDDGSQQARPLRAALAGLLCGICCYGYPAVRLFVPILLTAVVLVNLPAWYRLLKTRRGAAALAGLFAGLALTFGPLAYQHLTAPEEIGRRGSMTWLWSPADPLATRIHLLFDRYAAHFHPDFLFRHGDTDAIAWTAGFGLLPWYVLPLQIVGLIVLLPRLARSRAARLVLAGVILYPAGDVLNWHVSLHGLRSSAGLIPLLLLAAIGIVPPVAFFVSRRLRAGLLAFGVALAGLILPEQARFWRSYLLDRPRQDEVYDGNAVDLLEACAWLRPRLDHVDVVVCTALGMNQPYVITLVGLTHDPQRWFAEPRSVHNDGTWDVYSRYGKFHFLPSWETGDFLNQLAANGQPERVVLFLRPNQTPPAEPTHSIIRPDGSPALLIYDIRR